MSAIPRGGAGADSRRFCFEVLSAVASALNLAVWQIRSVGDIARRKTMPNARGLSCLARARSNGHGVQPPLDAFNGC